MLPRRYFQYVHETGRIMVLAPVADCRQFCDALLLRGCEEITFAQWWPHYWRFNFTSEVPPVPDETHFWEHEAN
jgi:hypothetical protein